MALLHPIANKLDRYQPAFKKVHFEDILTDLSTQIDNIEVGTVADNSITAAKLTADSVSSVKIINANVTLAKLAPGITPSHIVVKAGSITWSGSGASLATTIAGVAATDIVMCTIAVAPTQAAYIKAAAPTLNTITIVLSAANTSNDAEISYQVLRAAA